MSIKGLMPNWLKLAINAALRPFGVRRPMIGILPFLPREQRKRRRYP